MKRPAAIWKQDFAIKSFRDIFHNLAQWERINHQRAPRSRGTMRTNFIQIGNFHVEKENGKFSRASLVSRSIYSHNKFVLIKQASGINLRTFYDSIWVPYTDNRSHLQIDLTCRLFPVAVSRFDFETFTGYWNFTFESFLLFINHKSPNRSYCRRKFRVTQTQKLSDGWRKLSGFQFRVKQRGWLVTRCSVLIIYVSWLFCCLYTAREFRAKNFSTGCLWISAIRKLHNKLPPTMKSEGILNFKVYEQWVDSICKYYAGDDSLQPLLK